LEIYYFLAIIEESEAIETVITIEQDIQYRENIVIATIIGVGLLVFGILIIDLFEGITFDDIPRPDNEIGKYISSFTHMVENLKEKGQQS
jgi:hypothetical protein